MVYCIWIGLVHTLLLQPKDQRGTTIKGSKGKTRVVFLLGFTSLANCLHMCCSVPFYALFLCYFLHYLQYVNLRVFDTVLNYLSIDMGPRS
jgi:hypothetical protein